MSKNKKAPEFLNKNDVHTVEIEGMTHEGLGVARISNFAVFIEGVLPGETVEARVIKINSDYAVGKAVKILTQSKDRREPLCEIYKRCGGCALQHMDYKAQLEFKRRTVIDALQRIGKLSGIEVLDTIGMETPYNYRNKAQYPVAGVKDGIISGFYAKRSHEVIGSSLCPIQHPVSDEARAVVISFIKDNNISVYDEATGKGLLRHIIVRRGFKTGETMVVLVVNGKTLPGADRLVKLLIREIPSIKSIILNINEKRTNVITGDKSITLYGESSITDYIGKYKFRISPASFFQVNPVQTEVLYEKVLEYATLSGKETVLDIYCGAGTISIYLSERARKVYGIEVFDEAVRDAKENAQINDVNNVEFIAGKAAEETNKLFTRGVSADVVILDPPRKGCGAELLDTVSKMQPQRVVYVSCNPSTLARDLAYLYEKGLEARQVQPVDMFPWTTHVETVVLMSRKE
jgi:23S rRNA (uracil1939-C5)-methyltransferase